MESGNESEAGSGSQAEVNNALRARFEKAEADAWARLDARKGRLLSGLPMDDLGDYAIIGASKLADGSSI